MLIKKGVKYIIYFLFCFRAALAFQISKSAIYKEKIINNGNKLISKSVKLSAKKNLKSLRDEILLSSNDANQKSDHSTSDIVKLIENCKVINGQWSVLDFYSPSEYEPVILQFKDRVDFEVSAYGGYPQATKKRIIYRPCTSAANMVLTSTPQTSTSDSDESELQQLVTVMQITGSFIFEKVSAEDFYESILLLGISPEKIGDIIMLGDTGAQVIMSSSERERERIRKIERVREREVKCEEVKVSELKVRAPLIKQITSVEASMRLDALTSAGLSLSRSQVVKLVNKGEVLVNWKKARDAAQTLQVGYTVYVTGVGRLTIDSVNMTSKGRYRVGLTKSI